MLGRTGRAAAAAAAIAAMLAAAGVAAAGPDGPHGEMTRSAGPPSQEKGPVALMLQLEAAPSAARFRAMRRGGATRAAARRAARERRASIRADQRAVIAAVRRRGIAPRPLFRVGAAYNGVAVRARRSHARRLASIPGVKAVHEIPAAEPHLSSSVPFIGAPAAWAATPAGRTGEGMRIGIIDSGIDYTHAHFGGPGTQAAVDAAKAAEANPAAPAGVTSVPGFSVSAPGGGVLYPSAKVVGGWDFAGDAYNGGNAPVPDPNPMDCGGHGTHVAGIAGGYGVTHHGTTYSGAYDAGTPFGDLRIGPGVAPRAELYALRVFGCTGATQLAPAAIDWAIDPDGDGDPSDRLDVINLSLGSSFGGPTDPAQVAADAAAAAGVVVVASAGNSSDMHHVTGSPGSAPRAISVASSLDPAGGFAPAGFDVVQPQSMRGTLPATRASAYNWQSGSWVYAELVRPSDPVGCSSFSSEDAARLAGRIALLDAYAGGSGFACPSATRGNNAAAAGAAAVILIDRAGEATFSIGITGVAQIPMLMTTNRDGRNLLSAIDSGITPEVSMDPKISGPRFAGPHLADTIAGSSSRGPAAAGGALKPDLTAPGDSIVSARVATGTDSLMSSGTSMAAPHVTGMMALLRQEHPGWSVEELKALAMNTATHDTFRRTDQDGLLSPPRQGAGRVDVAAAVTERVVAYDSDRAGAVGLAFGAIEVEGTAEAERRITIADKGGSGGTFAVGYRPGTEMPGVSVSFPDGDAVTVPPGGSETIRVRLSADASQMRGTRDATLDSTQATTHARNYLTEVGGNVTLARESGPALRVPLHASIRPVATMRAAESRLVFNEPTDTGALTLTGNAVDTGTAFPTDLVSLVSPFELAHSSPEIENLHPAARAADLRHVAVSSDHARTSAAAGQWQTIRFAVATHGRWSSPRTVEFDIWLDADRDGTFESVLFNSTLNRTNNDVFVSEQCLDEAGFFCTWIDYLNGVSAATRNTAPFDSDVAVLSADVGLLELGADKRFDYYVASYSRYYEGIVDITPVLSFDPTRPGLDMDAAGIADVPLFTALPGTTLPVRYDRAAYEANAAQGALLIHHLNGGSARAEVVPVLDDPDAPASTILAPAAGPVRLDTLLAACDTPEGDLCGTADDGTDGAGVATVEIRLQRAADGLFFDGAGWVADEAWVRADGTDTWSLPVTLDLGDYTVASRASDAAGNVETPGSPVAFTVKPSQITPALTYTGDQALAAGSTLRLRAQLESHDSFVCAPAGRSIGFALDDDPLTAAAGDGPFTLGSGLTGADGTTGLNLGTGGWGTGVYTLAATLVPGDGCGPAADEAVLTVAGAGDAANGGGFYTLPGSGRVSFGFTVAKVPKTNPAQYRGQIVIVNNGKWRLKGTLSSFVKPTATSGAADGQGSLYRWDPTLDGGLGDWVLHATDVAVNARFSDGGSGKKAQDTFGVRIARDTDPPLPNSDPVPIKGGNVKVG